MIGIRNGKSYEYFVKNGVSVDLGQVQVCIARTKLNFNQASFLQSGGFDSKYNFS